MIDFGSSCFTHDDLSTYVQSRSYRAPEVILGTGYDVKIDLWSLGCILSELYTGRVLFQNDCVEELLSKVIGIIGKIPRHMISRGQLAHKYFLDGQLVKVDEDTGDTEIVDIQPSSIEAATNCADPEFLSFLLELLAIDPEKRYLTITTLIIDPLPLKQQDTLGYQRNISNVHTQF